MKLTNLSLLLLISTSIFAQTKECDCSGPLSKDLKTYISDNEYSDFKDWLYVYYQKDETTRTSLKNNASSSWGAKISTVIKAIPVSGSVDGSSTSSKDNQKYSRVEQSFMKNRYITNEELNELFVEEFSDNQLTAYLGCLKLCGITSGNGVFLYTGSETSDEFFIQVTYKSNSGGEKITLANNASYTNMEPISGLVFKENLVIKNGQSKTQYFKRLDNSKSASFTINVTEPIIIPTIDFAAKPTINQQATPIGTIVASILDYNTFLKANGLDKMENEKMETVLWIPCDGRKENKSKYSSYSGGNIPDLRGVFLRGINDYNTNFPSVLPVKDNQKNPKNTVAGEFQDDGIKTHTHDYQVGNAVNGHNYNTVGGEFYHPTVRMRTTKINNGAEEETRPKNITVYYYIKIN